MHSNSAFTGPSTRLFGTDGIRGSFGEFPLDRSTVTGLGERLGVLLCERNPRPSAVLGGDTRPSTPEICRWLAAGLARSGVACRHAGVLPTPGLAFLVRHLGGDVAISVSASHNPLPDNGIKLIDPRGRKWPVEAEARLEAMLLDGPRAAAAADPDLVVEDGLDEAYLRHLEGLVPGERPLAGLRLVLDPANGAASPYAARLFAELGAAVTVIHGEGDGSRINAGCGSTHPEGMARLTAASGADLGIAFDGDADRAVFADERGAVRDGDAALFLWALELARAGELVPPAVVATSMSNLGLERALVAHGIHVVRCDVGDRVVVETMMRDGNLLGGEQSGHIVHPGRSTTGDGLLTALEICRLRAAAGRPFSAMLDGFRRYPQLLRNVRVRHKAPLESFPAIVAAARSVEERLRENGRLVLRFSGTEPLARIMIEGPELGEIEAMAEELAAVIHAALGEA